MMAKPWNEHRGTITKLYIQEGRTLEDTRNIMRIQYNFEASIRSYRQHFDIWQIGKYNCKKRDKRRRQSLGKNLPPSPPLSPSDVPYYGEEGSSPVSSSSSSTSRRSSDQRPLPVLKQPQMYAAYFYDYARSQEDPQIKIENNGREPVWENIDVGAFRNSQVADGVLPSGVPIQPYPESTGWPVRGARSSYLASPPQTYCRAPFQDTVTRYVPEPTTLYTRGEEIRSVLRAPDLSAGKGNGGAGTVFHVVDYQNVARD